MWAMTSALRSWWELHAEKSRAARHVLSQADSWLSTSPAVYALTQPGCDDQRQNPASGHEHPSQPWENPAPSSGLVILLDSPDPDSCPHFFFFFFSSSPKNMTTAWRVRLTFLCQYHINVQVADTLEGEDRSSCLKQLWPNLLTVSVSLPVTAPPTSVVSLRLLISKSITLAFA